MGCGRLPELIEPGTRQAILSAIWTQQRLTAAGVRARLMPHWKRKVGTAQPDRSDGYATGLIALVLQQSGVSRDDARLRCGLSWLEGHQNRWNGH